MFRTLLERLACPRCRSRLDLEAPRTPDPVREGALVCVACGRRAPVLRGVPRLLPDAAADAASAATRASFERQWRRYGGLRRLFGKDPAAMRARLVGGPLGSLLGEAWYRGRVVLDAGCGHGRYLAAFASLGAKVVGLEATDAVDAAGPREPTPRLEVVQGDVLRMPFRDAAFDLAFCDGVLHHTTDPQEGFRELVRVTRPGGAVFVWLYPRERGPLHALFRAARVVTTRLPEGLVLGLAFAAAPLTALVPSYSRTRFPRATWAECAQVVHDWIAPRLQSHHDYEEAEGWAARCGCVATVRVPPAVGLLAWKGPGYPGGPCSPTSTRR